eukprot:TRINITY_DN8768_c0_g1_i1.p1 TRINITY_DN8768_c0_g1~~TRINITY_DN8768_c0_g1_i1.p1  ORF type:complete len:263 (-),score=72.62 TRINITY_DN8768_c0_g1_i1:95-883(-)
MVRLTAELIQTSPNFLNAVRERELNLRGNKIVLIENLGATLNGFDTIDLNDNEIQKLENFPLMPRLKTLYMFNNRVSSIATKLGEWLPNLDTLILAHNSLENLSDLDPLADLKGSLRSVVLAGNPVAQKPSYRLYLIHLLPKLRMLDWSRVKAAEKKAARAMFRGEEVSAKLKEGEPSKTFVPGQPSNSSALSATEVEALKKAIANAKTLDEVQFLERSLQQGKLPKHIIKQQQHNGNSTNHTDNDSKKEQSEDEEEEEKAT